MKLFLAQTLISVCSFKLILADELLKTAQPSEFFAALPNTWTNSASNRLWNDERNWSLNQIPNYNYDAILNQQGGSITMGRAFANNLLFGGANSFILEKGSLQLGGNSLEIRGSQNIKCPVTFLNAATVSLYNATLTIGSNFSSTGPDLYFKGYGDSLFQASEEALYWALRPMRNLYVESLTMENRGDMGYLLENLSFSQGKLINYGTVALFAKDLHLSEQVVEQIDGSLARNLTGLFTIPSSAVVISDVRSSIGPCQIELIGGTVENNGFMYVNGTSQLLSGCVLGSGYFGIAGSCKISTAVTQSTVVMGIDDFSFIAAEVNLCDILTANVVVTSMGRLLGTGTIVGALTVNPQGFLTPGDTSNTANTLTVQGNTTFDHQSIFSVNFDERSCDKLLIKNGNLTLISNPILNLQALTNFKPGNIYTLALLETSGLNSIQGQFEVQSSQPLINATVVYNPMSVQLVVNTYLFETLAQTHNQMEVAKALDALNGNTNPCLQSKIDDLLIQALEPINEALDTFDPAELKGQQIVLEQMSFIINNEISHQLYSRAKGFRPFAVANYEKLAQSSYNQYEGFSSDALYQLLGLKQGFDDWQILGAIGALETYVDYKITPSKSQTTSAITSLGASGFRNRWCFGLDALWGYHFIHTSRRLLPFSYKALSNHGAWNLKLEFKTMYSKEWKNTRFSPYDQLGYNFIHENAFTENGASCLDLKVKSSSRNMMRNTLGIRVETKMAQKAKRSPHVQPYFDTAWVWQNRFSGLNYRSRFVHTQPSIMSQGINQARNFGKLELGLLANGLKWNWKASFNGMWGQRYYELGTSLSVDRQF